MAAALERARELQLPGREREQHAVLHRELVHVAQLVRELAAQRAPALRHRAADRAAQRHAGAEREAGHREIGHRADRGADGRALAQAQAGVLHRLGIEEVERPAALDHRQRRLGRVALAEAVEREQVVGAALRLVEHGPAQRGDQRVAARGIGELGGRHAAPQRGGVDQQLGHARGGRAAPRRGLGLERVGHAAQQFAPVAQQRREVAVEIALGAHEGRGRVEAHLHVQAVGREQFLPRGFAAGRVAHEVEHRQYRPRAGIEQLDLVAELGQHRFAHVDHEEGGVDVEHGAQHLGLLLEGAVCLGALQEAADALGRRGLARGIDAREVLAQGHRVLEARRVVEAHGGTAVDLEVDRLDMARGAGAVGHGAEIDAPRERAQQ